MAARWWQQLPQRCPHPSHCPRTARRRQCTATTAALSLHFPPRCYRQWRHATATLMPRCRQAAKLAATAMLLLPLPKPPPPPLPPSCCRRRCRHRTATALPPPLLRCRCHSHAATTAAALPPCCPPQLCCSCCRQSRCAVAATLALPMPPPRCLPSPRRCCGRCIAVALPSHHPLPLLLRCRRAVHRHRCWLIVVFYSSARCSHDEKGWLWLRSDNNTKNC